jgi:hypothetical protein
MEILELLGALFLDNNIVRYFLSVPYISKASTWQPDRRSEHESLAVWQRKNGSQVA